MVISKSFTSNMLYVYLNGNLCIFLTYVKSQNLHLYNKVFKNLQLYKYLKISNYANYYIGHNF